MTINVTKIEPCKDISGKIDDFLNSIAVHLKKLSKRKKIHYFDYKKSFLILQNVWKDTIKLDGCHGGKLWQPFVIY